MFSTSRHRRTIGLKNGDEISPDKCEKNTMYRTIRRYLIRLRSGSRDRPSFTWATRSVPTAVPTEYSLDVEAANLAELPEDRGGPYLKALLGMVPLPVLRRAALRGDLEALSAAHLQTEEDLLEVAEETSELPVALAVAQNPAATKEVFLHLLSGPALQGERLDPSPLVGEIGGAILDNEGACTPEVMERMTSPFSNADFQQFEDVMEKIAASSALTKKLASRITSKAAARVCAQNPVLHFLISADPTLLADELGYHVERALVRREEASEELLRSAATNGSKGIRKAAAQHDNLPDDVYQQLLEDEMMMVRRALAARDDLPIHMLKELAEDPHPMVRQTIAFNARCPKENVIQLAGDAAGSVRAAAASQLECSEMLAELANDTRVAVRKRVAGNPRTPKSELYSLAFDPERKVRTAVAQNEASPPSLLSRLGVMDLFSVRLGVAGNRSALPKTLRRLVEDQAEEHKIRRVAQATLQTQASLQQKQAG